jgi:putative transcriptional regulator
MKKNSTVPAKAFKRKHRLPDAEITARAKTDPDNLPLTPADLRSFRRVSLARRVRQKLGVSQVEFARVFGIPIGTLRDWEQHRAEPDKAARSYLAVIAADPSAVRKALQAA